MEGNLKKKIAIETKKSEESLMAAEILLEKGLYTSSVSSAYYAVLHATRAVLLTKNVEPVSHEGVANRFTLLFVKEGIFDKKFSRLFDRLRKAREDGEYKSTVKYTKAEAALRLKEAKEFVSEIKKFVNKF